MQDFPKDNSAPTNTAKFTAAASTGPVDVNSKANSPAGGEPSIPEAASSFARPTSFDFQDWLVSAQQDSVSPQPGLGTATEPVAKLPGDHPKDGYFLLRLRHMRSGKALDGYYDEATGAGHLSIADENSGDSQRWVLGVQHEFAPLVKIWHNRKGILTYHAESNTLKLEDDRPYGDPAAMWRVWWDKPGERFRLVHNHSSLALDCNGGSVYMHKLNDGDFQLWDCRPEFKETFSRPLQGGVLIIGSLLWQDDRTREPGGQGRQLWRDFFLASDSSRIKVFAPIRYGRYSRLPKLVRPSVPRRERILQWCWGLEYGVAPYKPADPDDVKTEETIYWRNYQLPPEQPNPDVGGVYTMVLSRDTDKQHTPENQKAASKKKIALGEAWVWPFESRVRGVRELGHQILGLAQAEGIVERSLVSGPFLGGGEYGYAPSLATTHRTLFARALLTNWGMVTLLISPRCPAEDKELLTEMWHEAVSNYEFTKKPDQPAGWYTKQFSAIDEESCVKWNGQLDVQPLYTVEKGQPLFDETDLDFILATVTAPQTKGKERRYASNKNIASHILNDTRKYFQTNYERGIRTAHDEAIWAEVRRLQKEEPDPSSHQSENPLDPSTDDYYEQDL